jgi:hypothetical protein
MGFNIYAAAATFFDFSWLLHFRDSEVSNPPHVMFDALRSITDEQQHLSTKRRAEMANDNGPVVWGAQISLLPYVAHFDALCPVC